MHVVTFSLSHFFIHSFHICVYTDWLATYYCCNNMRNKANKSKNKSMMIIRFLKSPIKMLSKVRDFYVQSITNCAYGGPSTPMNLPRNFSATSSRESAAADEDLRELIRAVTQKGLIKDGKINMAEQIQQLQQQIKQQKEAAREYSSSEKGGLAGNLCTSGVLIETIDENVSCHFDAVIR